ncbi:MAG: hypothetical protein ABJA67_06690 [Chthonomonadales bacterium]
MTCRTLLSFKLDMLLTGIFVLVSTCVPANATPVADTSYIRELAKNKPLVVIVTSGPKATPIADDLRARLLNHPENRHKSDEIITVTIADLEKQLPYDPKKNTASYVWLINRSEFAGEVPDPLRPNFPLGMTRMMDGEGRLKSTLANDSGRGLTIIIAIAAPDASRMQSLFQSMILRTAAKYDNLPFSEIRQTNKIAMFSTGEDKEAAIAWAPKADANEWFGVKWYSMAESAKIPAEELKEYNQVYFVNRQSNTALPVEPSKLLVDEPVGSLTCIVKKQKISDTRYVAIYSAPNHTLLVSRMKMFPKVSAIPEAPVLTDAKDLRNIGRTSLVFAGSGPSVSEKETLALIVARQMRDRLGIDVQERTDTLDNLRREFTDNPNARRFAWQFTTTKYDGKSVFSNRERLVSEDKLVPFDVVHRNDDPEPRLVINSVGGGRKDEEDRKRPIYEREHESWLRRKESYENRAKETLKATWEREILQTSSATTKGFLRLIDLKETDSERSIIWELECAGEITRKPISINNETHIIRAGYKPKPLPLPNNQDVAPAEVQRESTIEAMQRGINYVQANALLPDGSGAQDAPAGKLEPEKPMPPTKDPKLAPIAVADIGQGVVTITAGTNRDLKVGDSIQVVFLSKKITDPVTGELLSDRVLDSIIMKVTVVDERTADCVPISTDEAVKFGRIKKGMAVNLAIKISKPPAPAKQP